MICPFLLFSGAFGYFEVTHDISRYCKAKVFGGVGKRTPIAVRFSTVGELGTYSITLKIIIALRLTEYKSLA